MQQSHHNRRGGNGLKAHMRLIERYIFHKIAGATTLTFVALGTMVWLSQALRQFDLVTANGQSVWTFLYVSALLVPALVTIVLPVALLIAVIYAFTNLNGSSELVVINSSGASQITVLQPVLMIGVVVTLLVASMSLYFAPLSLRGWQVLITNVRSDILTTVLQPGQFMQPVAGLTIHIRSRAPDGTLNGIFVSDDREPGQTSTYLAEKGAVIDNPLGVFMIMSNGTIQQRSKVDQSISMIEFSSYAFDLSSFRSSSTTPQLHPAERDTLYLLNPDPEDRYFREYPGKFRAELNNRLSSPLYGLLFAVLPLVFLGQAESPRQSRAASVTMAVIVTTALRAFGVFLPNLAETSMLAVWLMYAIPLGGVLVSSVLILTGRQLKPPEAIVAVAEAVFARASGMLRSGTPAPAGGAR
jgi:lipopolysaccharide export system permease protein